MPDLNFQIEAVSAVSHAATPLLSFRLRVTNDAEDESIQSVLLRSQIRIEVTRRLYNPHERKQLVDLFGEPERWGTTLRSLLWTHAAVTIPPFIQDTVIDLPVPCTFDFDVGVTKYFHGLSEGDLPLNFLFSGTVFYQAGDGALQVGAISWEKEASYRLPLSVWKELIDEYYPNTAWLCLRRDVFERMYQFKLRNGIPTWSEAVERVLSAAESSVLT